ncbi:hypothetical protein ACTXT7_014523 [Hymenolepis weldensis]
MSTPISGFIANFILGGLAKSYGIIMEAFQDEFDAPAAIFTLTGGVIYMFMFIFSKRRRSRSGRFARLLSQSSSTALPNHFVVQRIGDRAVVMIGGICACISLLVASVAPTVTVWAITIGGGVGAEANRISCRFSFSAFYNFIWQFRTQELIGFIYAILKDVDIYEDSDAAAAIGAVQVVDTRAEHQGLIRPKCIQRTTMESKKGKRKVWDRGDEKEAKEPVIDKRVCAYLHPPLYDLNIEVFESQVMESARQSFSFSCVYFNIFTVVGRCFRKHLGLANGLSVAGVSVGQMAFPSLVTHVLQNYGVRSGTLIMSAFSLHLCVTAALMPRYVVEAESTEQDLAISSSSLSRRTGEPSSSALPSPIGGSSSDIDVKEIDAMLRQKKRRIDQLEYKRMFPADFQITRGFIIELVTLFYMTVLGHLGIYAPVIVLPYPSIRR